MGWFQFGMILGIVLSIIHSFFLFFNQNYREIVADIFEDTLFSDALLEIDKEDNETSNIIMGFVVGSLLNLILMAIIVVIGLLLSYLFLIVVIITGLGYYIKKRN